MLEARVSDCFDDVTRRLKTNYLEFNTATTRVICFTTSRRQFQLPTSGLRIADDVIAPSSTARVLGGAFPDYDLSMRTHATRIVSHCFSALQQLLRCFPIACRISCADATRLWKCDTRRHTSQTNQTTTVGALCRRQNGGRVATPRPHQSIPRR